MLFNSSYSGFSPSTSKKLKKIQFRSLKRHEKIKEAFFHFQKIYSKYFLRNCHNRKLFETFGTFKRGNFNCRGVIFSFYAGPEK